MSSLRFEIEKLAHDASNLEPDKGMLSKWQDSVGGIVRQFYQDLGDLPAVIAHDNSEPSLTLEGSPFAESLASVVQEFSRAGVIAAGKGHLGFIPGGGLYVGAVGDYVASVVNTFSADYYSSPVAVKIHDQVLAWLAKLVGYSSGYYGDITSGGSLATVAALRAAREAKQIRRRPLSQAVVYLGEHTHHCVVKALDILGLAEGSGGEGVTIRIVPSLTGAMSADALERMIKEDIQEGLIPWVIVATVGSTNLGRVDPVDRIADIAQDSNIWLHIDGAYGGFFAMTERAGHLFRGIHRSDSIVLDPHKGMFLPYGSGAVLVRHGEYMRYHATGSYLQDRDGQSVRSPMDYSIELSRPFRALRIWLALKVHGENAFRAALEEKLSLAQLAYQELATIPEIELFGVPDLSIVAFRIRSSNDLTKELLRQILEDGRAFLSSTTIENKFYIRIAVLSVRTHLPLIDALLDIIRRVTTQLTG